MRSKQRNLLVLAFISLLACQTAQEKASEPARAEVSNQWLVRPPKGPMTSLAALCTASYTCEERLSSPVVVTAPFQQAGVLLSKSSALESPLLVLALGDKWFGIEGESLAPKELNTTSRVKHQFTSIQNKTIQQKPALLVLGTRREEVFCDSCANPISRTTPNTIYESEFIKLCMVSALQRIACTDTIDSAHDQDGPSKLLFELKDDGSLQLKSSAGLLTRQKRQLLEPGVYTVLVP
jgi:hypothetical protein